jgi:protoporphyrinogen oxidase
MNKIEFSQCDILIIGAGLAGLSAAWHLRDSGKKVRIVESADRVGGLTATDIHDGFRFDHTGHLLHLRDEAIKKWVVEDLFRGDILSLARESRVWSSGVYTRYPFQANTFGLPKKVADECISGYLKVLENPPKKKIKSAEDFIYHHFGTGFAKYFMIPYNQKIWGVHPRAMSAAWGERFVPVPKKEDVMAGMLPDSKRELGYNTNFLYPRLGMGELSEKMYQVLRATHEVEFHKKLVSLDIKNKVAAFADGEQIAYHHLVSTMPLKELLKADKKIPASIKKKSAQLKHKSLYYLNIALNIETPAKFQWCYVPSSKIPFYRVGVYSNLSKDLVPSGCSSLYVELSERKFAPKVIARVIPELIKMGLFTSKKDIRFIDPHFVPYAYVIYDKNYYTAVPVLHAFLEKNDIHSVGRYGAWHYSSMEDAIKMGREVGVLIK